MTIKFQALATGNFGQNNIKYRDWQEDVPVIVTAEFDNAKVNPKLRVVAFEVLKEKEKNV